MAMSLQKQMAAGFIVSALLLAGVYYLGFNSVSQLINSTRWVNHTYEVLSKLSETQASLQSARSAQRTYLLSGQPFFVTTFRDKIAALRQGQTQLKRLTQDDPVQQQNLAALDQLMSNRLGQLERQLGRAPKPTSITAELNQVTLEEQQLNTAIEQTFDQMMAEEQRLLKVRDVEKNVSIQWLIWGGTGAAITILVLFVLLFVQIDRAIRLWQTANRQLSEEVVERKAMAASLEEARVQALTASSAKSDFLAVMSHEIRTPMNGVIGMTSLLSQTPLNEEQSEYVQVIRRSGEAMLLLINDLLDFSKVEAGKMELEKEPVNLRLSIEETLELLSTKANEKHLNLIYTVDPLLPPSIEGDGTRLRQILVNLVSNAIKFTERGHVRVDAVQVNTVRVDAVQVSDGDGHSLELRVIDTGIGIAADKTHTIFESFSQADTSTTRKHGGTGLGLTICQKLADKMGGNIRVESELGRGATFILTLPYKARAPKNLEATTASPFEYEASLQGIPVLVVSDAEEYGAYLQLLCRQWGMTVCTRQDDAPSGEPVFHPQTPQIAIGDFHSSLHSGVCQWLKQHNIPVVPLLSAALDSHDERLAKETYPLYLTKPFKHGTLKQCLVALITHQAVEKNALNPHATVTKIRSDLAALYPMRILVAEDHPVNQRLAQRLLEKMGYQPDIVGNGLEALEAVQQGAYDLVFMDVQMPEMDGMTATRHIVSRYGQDVRPIVIAMTAHAAAKDREECLSVGMDDFVGKPIQVEELQAAIERWGAKRLARRQQPLASAKTSASGGDSPSHKEPNPVQAAKEVMVSPASALPGATVAAELDWDSLWNRLDEDPALLHELAELFLDTCPPLLNRLEDQVARGDVSQVHTTAHQLKGMFQNMSARGMEQLSAKLEACTDEELLTKGHPMMMELSQRFGQAKTQIQQRMDQVQG